MIPRVKPEGMLFRKPVPTPDQVRGKLFRDHALANQSRRNITEANQPVSTAIMAVVMP
jgi:hypothetical protein